MQVFLHRPKARFPACVPAVELSIHAAAVNEVLSRVAAPGSRQYALVVEGIERVEVILPNELIPRELTGRVAVANSCANIPDSDRVVTGRR